jgi:hypothetical protein
VDVRTSPELQFVFATPMEEVLAAALRERSDASRPSSKRPSHPVKVERRA